MAEVLAAHQDAEAPNGGRVCICGEWEGPWTGTAFATHLEDMLTAAGFGSVVEAKAEALEEAADSTPVQWDFVDGVSGLQIRPWLRARAAAVRGEG